MTHTTLDSQFLQNKHLLVDRITGELLNLIQKDEISVESGRECAREILEVLDELSSEEDLKRFIKLLLENYPFFESAIKDFQMETQSQDSSLRPDHLLDDKKLQSIQDQLTKLSQ